MTKSNVLEGARLQGGARPGGAGGGRGAGCPLPRRKFPWRLATPPRGGGGARRRPAPPPSLGRPFTLSQPSQPPLGWGLVSPPAPRTHSAPPQRAGPWRWGGGGEGSGLAGPAAGTVVCEALSVCIASALAAECGTGIPRMLPEPMGAQLPNTWPGWHILAKLLTFPVTHSCQSREWTGMRWRA